MLDFARDLPALRRVAYDHLDATGPYRERTLALAIRLLDVGMFRVGWDRYVRDNGHVGLTTLRREHVSLLEQAAQFDFIAKSGKRRRMTVRDPQAVDALAPLKRRRGAPAELLAYRTDGGTWHRVTAPDVNNALRAWAEAPYSAKEFRTWTATVLAAVALARQAIAGNRSKSAVSRATREVSTALGNTPSVARASYIDPRVIQAYEAGRTIELPADTPDAAMPLHIEAANDQVVVELPTEPAGDAVREVVERRVLELLSSTAAAAAAQQRP